MLCLLNLSLENIDALTGKSVPKADGFDALKTNVR